jgi:ABC-2 type transport system permease protein
LVQPFTSEVELAAPRVNKVTDWYAPAAIVLMLQQFGVAFGALSFVRERQLGITDVLRIAPINAPETLFGKYLAYLVIGGGIATLLTALVVNVLDVPIAASVRDVAIVLGLTLFASIGLGFVISLISKTDSQAVQYTMILLLASLFFSGFFLSVGHMEGAARFIGWLLPVTYGMELLRDVMLRGTGLDRNAMLGLIAYGVVAFALALYGTRRRMALAT